MTAAWAVLCRAMIDTERGRLDRAWPALRAVHQMAALLQHDPRFIVACTGMVLQDDACAVSRHILARSPRNATLLNAMLQHLAGLPAPHHLEKVMTLEHMVTLSLVLQFADDPSELMTQSFINRHADRWLDINMALQCVNAYHEKWRASLTEPDPHARCTELKAAYDRFIDRLEQRNQRDTSTLHPVLRLARPAGDKRLTVSPAFANHVMAMRSVCLGDYLPSFMSAEADRRRLELELALRLDAAQRGEWPDKLDDLTPHVIAQLPNDPFTGKPLRYICRDGAAVFWSVGDDFVDDGGLSSLDPHGLPQDDARTSRGESSMIPGRPLAATSRDRHALAAPTAAACSRSWNRLARPATLMGMRGCASAPPDSHTSGLRVAAASFALTPPLTQGQMTYGTTPPRSRR